MQNLRSATVASDVATIDPAWPAANRSRPGQMCAAPRRPPTSAICTARTSALRQSQKPSADVRGSPSTRPGRRASSPSAAIIRQTGRRPTSRRDAVPDPSICRARRQPPPGARRCPSARAGTIAPTALCRRRGGVGVTSAAPRVRVAGGGGKPGASPAPKPDRTAAASGRGASGRSGPWSVDRPGWARLPCWHSGDGVRRGAQRLNRPSGLMAPGLCCSPGPRCPEERRAVC